MFAIFATLYFILVSSLVSSQHAEPNSTPLTNRFIGGTYDYDERNTIYFAQNGIFKCAGYLIAWRLAIGSGQCLFGLEPPLFSGFTISNKFLFKPGEDLEISDLVNYIEDIKVHEDFDPSQSQPYLNDIAVILLKQRAKYDPERLVPPLFLPNRFGPRRGVSLVGWSPVNNPKELSYLEGAKSRRRMNFISIDNESCGKSLECETIDESLMCAISAEGYVTEEDAGSPLFIPFRYNDNKDGVIGLVTFTNGNKKSPVVFTKISSYFPFICGQSMKFEKCVSNRSDYNSTDFIIINYDSTYDK